MESQGGLFETVSREEKKIKKGGTTQNKRPNSGAHSLEGNMKLKMHWGQELLQVEQWGNYKRGIEDPSSLPHQRVIESERRKERGPYHSVN